MRTAGHFALALALVAIGCSTAPVRHVVEEHHEMVLVLHGFRERGILDGPVTLVHVDAHADLGCPSLREPLTARPGECPERHRRRLERLVASGLAVDDVLVPAVMLGLVNRVFWLTPGWSTEEARTETIEVGSRGGRGREYARGDRLDDVAYPDRRAFPIAVSGPEGLGLVEAPWVLGIDLDFFDCRNPHADHVDHEAIEEEARRLLRSGRVLDEGSSEEARRVVRSTLVEAAGSPWPRRVDRIEDADGVLWVIGWRCLGEATDTLPEHEASPEEVAVAVRRLVRALARVPVPPALVVICRSARSGFVPADRVDAIQARVAEALDEIDRAPRRRYRGD